MKSFTAILALVALAAFSSHTGGVSAAPVSGARHLQKRAAAVSASTWRAEQDPRRRQVASGVESGVAGSDAPSSAANVAQAAETLTGTDKEVITVGSLTADSTAIPADAEKVAKMAQGVGSSSASSGDNAVNVDVPGNTPEESGSASVSNIRREGPNVITDLPFKSMSSELNQLLPEGVTTGVTKAVNLDDLLGGL